MAYNENLGILRNKSNLLSDVFLLITGSLSDMKIAKNILQVVKREQHVFKSKLD